LFKKKLLAFRRTIRDPLYGYVPITELENRIIDTAVFQRLDRVTQMHSVHLIYPNAKYSRKCHSLGAMHLAHRALCSILFKQCRQVREHHPALLYTEPVETGQLERLREESDISADLKALGLQMDELVQVVRLAGLLHDLGHAPFSHLFETVCRDLGISFDHEQHSRRLIRQVLVRQAPELPAKAAELVCRLLKGISPGDGKKAAARRGATAYLPKELGFLHHIISGPMDCDKLDYLSRDAYHSGARELGAMDVDRVLQGLVAHRGQMGILRNHVTALLKSFQSYYFMYNSVYFHKACRRFDLTLADILKERREVMQKTAKAPEEYDDARFWQALVGGGGKGQNRARQIADCFHKRQKRYALVARRVITVPALTVQAMRAQFARQLEEMTDQISDKVRGEHAGVELVWDSKRNIRSIGLKLEEIIEWLAEKVVVDPKTGQASHLSDHATGFFANIAQVHYPINVFVRLTQDGKPCPPPGGKIALRALRRDVGGLLDEKAGRLKNRAVALVPS